MKIPPGFGKASAYLLLVTLQLLLGGCEKSAPEEEIRQALTEIENAAEAGDTGTLMDYLDDRAQLQRHGHELTRQEIQRLLMGIMLRYRHRQVTFTNIRIEVDPVTLTQARVQLTALVWGGRQRLPESADTFQVDSQWQRDGQWRIRQVSTR
ncbi:hypothetical protein A11A3_01535 [Alcanivorax hongdengensis A-11-3]|uniref:DUF4440 domain-containing protein n=1 Tax=Alcanivorax hongdengensis A-11-3 TaxID=1177179 RepID=L0WJX3_9GAMM|nr:nuclear transport factor 2 family protein [Alcanivorax hongdengensis]EKF76135.1 hypothetical protein A11A3_01535 [Alcanivorax hongdengensis A-11-3]